MLELSIHDSKLHGTLLTRLVCDPADIVITLVRVRGRVGEITNNARLCFVLARVQVSGEW